MALDHDDCIPGVGCVYGSRDCPAGVRRMPYYGRWDMAHQHDIPSRVDWWRAVGCLSIVFSATIIALLVYAALVYTLTGGQS